jgi:transcriptional regulator with XRE-family HTH domain
MKKKPTETKWFKKQMIDREITQRQIAKALKKNFSAVSRMLSGKQRMTLEEGCRMAEFFGVSTDDFADKIGIKPSIYA